MRPERSDGDTHDGGIRMVLRTSELVAERARAIDELLHAASEAICDAMADACVIGILLDNGRKIHPLGLYHRDPGRQRDLESLSELAWETVEGVTRRVLDAGKPEVLSPRELELASHTRPWAATLLEGWEIHAALALPMRAFGATVGIMGVARSAPGRDFAAAEIPFVQDVANRLGLAVLALHLEEELEHATITAPAAEPADERLAALTAREHEILAMITSGLSSREIGEQLYLSVRTVEWHRARLMVKVGASKRSELIAVGRMLGPRP